MNAQKPLLEGLLEMVAANPDCLVVFDLDDTLFSTADRHLRILSEYAQLIASRHAHAADKLRAIKRDQLRYSVADTAKEAGLEAALVKDLRDFWFARFFKNNYLLEDSIIPGGPEFATEVAARGGRPVYMTGRDEGMREGTEASLRKHAFPSPDGKQVRLILKPRFDTPDLSFKSETLRTLGALGTVSGSFENEPAHVNLFVDAFPEGRHFLLETKHSGKPVVPHASVHRIKDFRR